MSTATQTQLPAATWGVDPVHSTAGFSIKYMVSTFRAGFAKVDATLDTTGDTPVLKGSVDPTTIDVKDENFHAHLQSPDFFDSERHPAITFESTGWRTEGDVLVVDGNLTIKGDTRPVEARGVLVDPHEDPWGNTRLGRHARGEHRPLALRHHLEQPAAQGRPRAGQRRQAARRPPAGPGVMKVLGISGSLRRDSHNAKLLRAAGDLLPPGVELELWEGLKAVPPYDADDDGGDRDWSLVSLDAAIRDADAVLFSTPEYNHSVPGQLKNALDWLSRPLKDSPLRNKPAAVVGASTGLFGAVWAQAELRKVLGAIGARVVDRELPVGLADDAFADDGGLADDEQRLDPRRPRHRAARRGRSPSRIAA